MKKTPTLWVLMGIIFLANAYVTCFWAAFRAVMAYHRSSLRDTSEHWEYYVFAFLAFLSPLTYMSAKERKDEPSGSGTHTLIATIAFILFCIWPYLVLYPYGGRFIQSFTFSGFEIT